jgi:YesN/AraC family two-component response regulator
MSDMKIKVLQIGAGSMGTRRMRDLCSRGDVDVALLDMRLDRRERAEQRFGIETYGTITVEDKTYLLSPNSFCIIAPGVHHVVKPGSDSETKLANFRFSYSEIKKYPDYLHETQKKEMVEIKDTLTGIRYSFIDNACEIMLLIDQVYSEIFSKSLGYYSKIQSLFSQILIEILRLISPKKKEKYSIPKRSNDDRRSALIESFFHKHYSISNISINHLAKVLNLSVRHTNRILRTTYDSTFSNKLTETRIEAAKDLLYNTVLSISQISERTGYSSQTYFHKVFKDKTGMTPQSYRALRSHT